MNKKIYLLLFVIFTLASNYSNAQRFGLKVAFSKPDYKFEDVRQDKTQLYQGYQIGIYGRSDSRIYLQPEIYYHKKEGRFTNEPGKQEFDQSITLHTINIPLVLGLNVIKHKNFTLHGFGGVQSAVVVDNNITSQKPFAPITKSNIENITVKYFWGAGIDLFFLSFDVRYYTEPISTISESNDLSFPYLKNYYTFNLGLKLLK